MRLFQPTRRRAIVLLSGGLDSVICAAWAEQEYEQCLALTIDYGQRAAQAELRAAEAVADRLGMRWQVLELPWLGELGGSALVDCTRPLPTIDPLDLDNSSSAKRTARALWVPNRNGVFVAVAGAYADAWRYTDIILGLNREEGASFPDNTEEFAEAATNLLAYSTMIHARVISPTVEKTKIEIVRMGLDLDAPLDLVWSCYEKGPEPCWECEACRRLQRALEGAGVWPDSKPQWGAGQ